MSAAGPDPEEKFADLLAEFEQSLTSGSTADDSATPSVELDPKLAAEWSGAVACLELIDRVRRHWSPLADRETPRAGFASLATANAGLGTALGRYEILRELGAGGLGIVYLAYDPKLHRQVALKVPRPEALLDADLRRRFLREAEAAARLSHPNLVGVYEASEAGAICYIASEFCPGPTLGDWLRQHPEGVRFEAAARLVRQLALAVQHAHGRGVLHRDIKPSNVLLTRPEAGSEDKRDFAPHPGPLPRGETNDELVPKLTDFGMAKLLEREGEQTRSGVLVGTPAYMAPEQAQGRVRDLDARTDVYALGAILYELLTGRRVFESVSDVDALRSVLFEEPIAPRRLRSAIPRDMEAICLKCLAKLSAARYATAQQLADDLERFLAGKPTEARPLGAVARLSKWAKRRPALAALLTLAAVSAVALFAVVVVFNARLKDEVARAEMALSHAQQDAEARRRMLYASDVRRAYEAFKVNNTVQALEALERHAPRSGEVDLREFAWHYLFKQCQGDCRTLEGHNAAVMAVDYSPDGRRLATGSADGTARLWDAATGVSQRILPDDCEIDCVAFSLDGATLATGNVQGAIRLWNIASGESATLEGHTDQVLALAHAPGGRYLASGSRDRTVRIWDLTGATLPKVLPVEAKDRLDVVRAVTYSPQGDVLYVVDEAGKIFGWGTKTWDRAVMGSVSQDKFFALAVCPTDGRVATAGRRRRVFFWKPAAKKLELVEDLPVGHSEWIQALAFSPADGTLASGGKDRIIQLWKPGETQASRTLMSPAERVWSIDWSPDGRHLAGGSADGAIRIWTVGDEPTRGYPPLRPDPHCAVFAAGGSGLYTGWNDGRLRQFDSARRCVATSPKLHRGLIGKVAVAPDESAIATVEGGVAKVWRATTYEVLFELRREDNVFGVLDWSADGQWLAVSEEAETVALVDTSTWQIARQLRHDSAVSEARFTPNSTHLVTSGSSLRVWDVTSARQICSLAGDCSRLAMAPDGRLVAASTGAQVTVFDLLACKRTLVLATVGTEKPQLAIHGNTLAAAVGAPHCVTLWDLRTGQELARLDELDYLPTSVAFTRDGTGLIATGHDAEGNGRIWEWTIRRERFDEPDGSSE